ncbi:MAG: radical SAM protein, partial [Hyphomicrobiales bacterium]|nr:radical SAM protein [Hyphomicrobiales bacterium]
EFFFLTPLPGSEDHKVLHLKGARMDPDMNNYDLEHVCADHPIMSAQEWRGVYRDAWARYYTDAHVETVLRRAVKSGISPKKIVDAMTVFSGSSRIERVHPLQFGYVRRKIRTQRRHGTPLVNPLVFYPWRAWDFTRVAAQWAALALRYRAIYRRVVADKTAKDYVDEALRPSTEAGHETDFVAAYADKIPDTYGAPKRERAQAAE